MFAFTPSRLFSLGCIAVIAVALFSIPFIRPAQDSVSRIVGEHRVEGNIVDVDRGPSTAAVVLADIAIDGAAKSDRVKITVPRYPAPVLGDRIAVVCSLERPEPFDGFAYDAYLAIRDIYAVCRTNDIPLVVTPNADERLVIDLARLRDALIDRIDATLPQPHASLLAGLLLGEANFSAVWQERFLDTGTTHIVAASGFNISLVILVLFAALTSLGVRRQYAFPFLIAGVAAYVILAGAEPAVIRAGAMGSLVLFARHLGRKTTMRNVVLLAAALMLALEPRLALYDVGFQLSIVSTVALIWFAPVLARRFLWIPAAFGIREALVSSLAATIATLPITLTSFGRISFIGPLVNVLILPFVPLAMALGVLVLAGNTWLALPAWTVLSVMLEIIRAIAALPLL